MAQKKPRVVIAVPLATPWIYWRTVAAILELKKPDQVDLMVFQGALVDRARNHLIKQMLCHPMKATHILFLDYDILPPPDTLTKLLTAQKPLITGLYRKRLPPYEFMAFTKKSSGKYEPLSLKPGQTSPLPIDVAGAGCLLIERNVLEKIPSPWFTSEWREEGHLSEDFSFCEKAREAGFPLFVDPTVRPVHLETVGIGTEPGGGVQFEPMD